MSRSTGLAAALVTVALLTTPTLASAENAMFVRPNGKIVVAGGKRHGTIARYLPGGQLDRGFGGRGVLVDSRLPAFEAVAVQSDGKIVAVGGPGFQVARYLPDGKKDLGFGQDGISGSWGTGEVPVALVIESDGSIIVAGTSFEKLGGGPHPTAIRIGTDGRSVEGFGFGRGTISDLLNAPEGALIAAGEFYEPFRQLEGSLFRFTLGSKGIDDSFGHEGFATAPGNDASAVTRADGKLLTVGSIATARFGANGLLDPSFGVGGIVGPGPFYAVEVVDDIAVAVSGGVATAGSRGLLPPSPGKECRFRLCPKIFVRRLTASGAPLETFGRGGRTILRRPDGRKLPALAKSVAVFRSGKVLVMGITLIGAPKFVLGKFDARGRPDTRFGHGGVTVTAIG